MELHEFIHRLSDALKKSLPGYDAQARMSSLERIRELMSFSDPGESIPSSVLILFYPGITNEISFVLIHRPEYDGIHSGQISLPGGRHEDSDRDLSETALRESEEEIGVDISRIEIIGKLSELYIPPSNYMVTPFIGYCEERPVFRANPDEVAGIIEIRLNDLLDEENVKVRNIRLRDGLLVEAPCFEIDGNRVWGATAMILSEMKQVAAPIWL